MNSSILDPLVFEPELGGQILCIGGPQHGRIIHLPPLNPGQLSVKLPSHAPEGGYCHPTYNLKQYVFAEAFTDRQQPPIWVLVAESVNQTEQT